MTSSRLTSVAADLRAKAKAATGGRWGVFGMTVLASTDGTSNADTATEVAQALTTDERGMPRTWDADYIAAMHPAVALALADWLDHAAIREKTGQARDERAYLLCDAYEGAHPEPQTRRLWYLLRGQRDAVLEREGGCPSRVPT